MLAARADTCSRFSGGNPIEHAHAGAEGVRDDVQPELVHQARSAPPAVPWPVPLAGDGAEHVAAHDVSAGAVHLLDLGSVLVGVVEHPGVQPVAPAVAAVGAEGTLLGLVGPGGVPVCGDGLVNDDPAHEDSPVG